MGRKVSREAAISALVAQPNIKEAAAACGVSEKTLHAWLNEPEFAARLAESQRGVTKRITRAVISKAERAINVLDEIMSDGDTAAQARVTAAKAVLEYSMKAIETEEIMTRIEQLEKTQNESKWEDL